MQNTYERALQSVQIAFADGLCREFNLQLNSWAKCSARTFGAVFHRVVGVPAYTAIPHILVLLLDSALDSYCLFAFPDFRKRPETPALCNTVWQLAVLGDTFLALQNFRTTPCSPRGT